MDVVDVVGKAEIRGTYAAAAAAAGAADGAEGGGGGEGGSRGAGSGAGLGFGFVAARSSSALSAAICSLLFLMASICDLSGEFAGRDSLRPAAAAAAGVYGMEGKEGTATVDDGCAAASRGVDVAVGRADAIFVLAAGVEDKLGAASALFGVASGDARFVVAAVVASAARPAGA